MNEKKITTILHQGSHKTTHQMKPQSTVPNYETAWRKKLGRHTMHQTRFLQSPILEATNYMNEKKILWKHMKLVGLL
jgi:hypothetical protein